LKNPSIPAWQWAVLFLCFFGALVFGGLAIVQLPYDPTFKSWTKSNPAIASVFPPSHANSSEKAATLSVPSLIASRTATATITYTPTPTFTPTATATPTETPTFTPTSSPTETQTPTPTDTPSAPPVSAQVDGVHGYAQFYALSCESRSAVDLAAFFDLSISEVDFQAALPRSDDPDMGFVGVPWGLPGQIPPYSYGVHAAPVAALLRAYGLPANEQVGMSYESMQWEIAAGRPVMVWVISGLIGGYTVDYTVPSSGRVTRVAYNEHTMLVTGYTANTVTVQDGAWSYTVSLSQFLNSWAALGNMAITVGE
jgi:uncharacterized protein YvpB